MRIAVIGSGASGLTATWLLQPNFDVTCFEASTEIGGNVQSRTIQIGGESLKVQLGPTYLLPKDYTAFFKILSILKVPTEKISMQLSVLDEEGGAPFASPSLRPLRLGSLSNMTTAKDLIHLRTILAESLKLIKRSDSSTTWRDFVTSLDVPKEFIANVATPIASAFFGLSYQDVGDVSASFGLLYMALCLPTLTNGIQFGRGVVGGTHRWIEVLGSKIKTGTIYLDCEVHRIKPVSGDEVLVEHSQGQEVFDRVVVSAQPWIAAEIVDDEELKKVLRQFPSFPAEIAIHQEPLVNAGKNNRSHAMVVAGKDSAQLSTYAGSAGGEKIYRSWITSGPKFPEPILANHFYRHLLPLPAIVNAQKQIRTLNRKGSIYFAGAWTHDLDSHEAAVRSGIGAARALGANNHLLSELGDPKSRYGFGTARF